MKLPAKKSRITILAAALACGFATTPASAGILYWDGNATGAVGNPPTEGVGGTGTWEPGADVSPNWWNGTAYQLWSDAGGQDVADFRGTSGTVTLAGNVTATKLNIAVGNMTLTGSSIDLGSAGVIDFNKSQGNQLTSQLQGAITLNATGSTTTLVTATAGTINGNNTQVTATVVNLNGDNNHFVLNHAGAFGSAGADVKVTRGIVNLGNTAATAISYNAWDLELNGGTLRARFGIQTVNGPVTVTANSELLTRGANDLGQDPKLVFSSTATINLGANTLILHPATAAGASNDGIELNGVISGAGGLTQQTSALTGAGTMIGTTTLNANNTYTGDTLINNGTLALSSTGGLKFVIGADGVNNQITGVGTVSLDGLFTFDLTNASTTINDSWNIVDVATLTESFTSNFAIAGFTPDAGGILWNGSANGADYQFSEFSGVLTVIPEPSAALLGGLGALCLLRRRR